jgi:hypothetical protein
MEGPARVAGLTREELSNAIGGELEGRVLEVISDLFSKGWLSVVVNAVAGGIALGYAIYGKDVSPRLRRELIEVGSHLAFKALEVVKFVEFKASLDTFVKYLSTGNVDAALSTILKSPAEVMATVVGVAPTAPAPISYTVTPPPPPPAPAPAPVAKAKPRAY